MGGREGGGGQSAVHVGELAGRLPLFSHDEASSAADFLARTPFVRLSDRFDPAAMAAADVYPNVWNEPWALEYLGDTYGRLTVFFGAAAARGEHVVVWMS